MQFVDSLPNGSVIKNPSANVGDTGDVASIPGSGKPPGGRRGKSLQYSFFYSGILAWKIPGIEESAFLATVQGVAKSRTLLSD